MSKDRSEAKRHSEMHIQGPVLLTGGSGFLGQRLKEGINPEICNAPTSSELDLLDLDAVRRYLDENKILTIVHAAGFVGGIGLNKAYPGQMISDNLRMGLNILQAAAEKKNIHVGIVSTVCVYPEDAQIPTPETALYDGYPAQDTAFYGIAKRTLHTMAEGLHRECGLTYSYVIPTNLYGPGDHFSEKKSHVVPALIRRSIEATESGEKHLVAWGDGSQTRDLLYVEDAVDGILASLRPEGHNAIFNLGSGREISIKELLLTICEVVGFTGDVVWDTSKPGGAPRRALNAEKARTVLGFRPRVELREGIAKTHQWYMQKRKEVINE